MTYIKNPSKEQRDEWRAKATDQENNARDMINKIAENYRDNPEEMAELFEFGSRFYDYSVKNNMLMLSQNRGSTYVQSFDAWKKMGFSVKAKEHGLKIFVPVKTTYLKIPNEASIPLSKATKEQKEAYKAGKIEGISRLHFKIGNVFDIAQTNYPKEDYPKLFCVGYPSEVHNDIYKGLKEFSETILSCPVIEKNLNSIALKGTYHPVLNKIQINELMEDTQRLSVLTHELGHALIHRGVSEKSTVQKELEADAISIMIQANYGIPLTEARKRHLANHYNAYKVELLNKVPEDKQSNALLDEALGEIYSSVFSIYSENIEQINLCVEHYVQHEKLQKIIGEKNNSEKEIETLEMDMEQKFDLKMNDLAKGIPQIQKSRQNENSPVQKACREITEKKKGFAQDRQLDMELER